MRFVRTSRSFSTQVLTKLSELEQPRRKGLVNTHVSTSVVFFLLAARQAGRFQGRRIASCALGFGRALKRHSIPSTRSAGRLGATPRVLRGTPERAF